MRNRSAKDLFVFDRDAETSPKRLAILIGIGIILLILTLWMFRDDEPAAPPSAPPPPQPVTVVPQQPLQTPSAAPSVSPAQLTLHGVTGTGTNGAAIIDVAGQGQRLVRIGRDVVPGLRLIAVAADHVILQDRGNEIRLGFPQASGSSAVSSVASASSTPAPYTNTPRDALE